MKFYRVNRKRKPTSLQPQIERIARTRLPPDPVAGMLERRALQPNANPKELEQLSYLVAKEQNLQTTRENGRQAALASVHVHNSLANSAATAHARLQQYTHADQEQTALIDQAFALSQDSSLGENDPTIHPTGSGLAVVHEFSEDEDAKMPAQDPADEAGDIDNV